MGAVCDPNAALVYNSDTADTRPILVTSVTTDASRGVPTNIQLDLTWNGVTQVFSE